MSVPQDSMARFAQMVGIVIVALVLSVGRLDSSDVVNHIGWPTVIIPTDYPF